MNGSRKKIAVRMAHKASDSPCVGRVAIIDLIVLGITEGV